MMPCHKTGDRISQMDRKAKKPLMEKRRRARINKCLGDLKNLLLEHLKRDPSQTSKLEKADILEMTVHLLRRMQQDQLMRASVLQPSVRDRFLDGWRDCAAQVGHYAQSVDGMPDCMKKSLQRYLAERYRILQHTLPTVSFPCPSVVPGANQRPPATGGPFFSATGPFPGPPGGVRPLFPPLCPPALNPSVSASTTQPWNAVTVSAFTPHHSSVMPTRDGMAHFSNSVLQHPKVNEGNGTGNGNGNRNGNGNDVRREEWQRYGETRDGEAYSDEPRIGEAPTDTQSPVERPFSSGSESRAMTDTPPCMEEEGDEDIASCSSSDATDEGTTMAKDVWRPW